MKNPAGHFLPRCTTALLITVFAVLVSMQSLSVIALPAVTVLNSPVRGETDTRGYRNLQLANGMKVLLVSDPAADKAAAALDVATGSGDDPQERQGLAHFLEHMLFLGTRKYPQPGEYQTFISEHGGSHNAFTALEHTNYFFDIDPQHLEPALDRFAQFFVAPLFNAEYVNREKNAVDSEYQARITDDGRRLADVYRELYHANNPAATFGVGSLATLGSDTVRNDLLAFYETYYSANVMTLVVIGREPLPVLQEMVEKRFAAVVDRHRKLDDSPLPVFRDSLLPARLQVQSRRDERHLQLVFPLPSMQPYFRSKPASYLSYLLGHEGEHSLFAVLKQRGWAERLAAGQGLSNRFASTFEVDITLTQEGYRHVDDVIALFFQTVAMLKESGIAEWQYEEQKVLSDLAFRFQEKQDAMEYASLLANNLQYYPPADVLRGDYLMEKLEKDLVGDVLARLTPVNMLEVVMAPDATPAPPAAGVQVSQYYQTPYTVESVAADKVATLGKVGPTGEIVMPVRNPFIPDKLKLKPAPLLSKKGELPRVPQKLTGTENFTVWYLQDTDYQVPKGSIMVYVRSPHASASVRDAAMSELFVRLLNDHLNPMLYTASLGGLDFDISKRSRGIAFQLTGYSDKQGLLLRSVMDTFRKPVFTEERFALVKKQWQDELRNADKQPPYRQLMQDVPVVLAHGYWGRKDYLQTLDEITLQAVQDYVLEFSGTIVADVLVYGNFYQAEAEKLASMVENTLELDSQRQPDVPVRVVELAPVTDPLLYLDEMVHNDATLVGYFQGAGDSVAQQVRTALLAQVLAAPFFHALRTEQQLGYIVSASYLPLARVPGMVFLVQSPTYGLGDINQRLQAFLEAYFKTIEVQDAAWFEQQRQALLTQLQQQPENLAAQSIEFWNDMTLGYTNFDHREQQIAALENMTLQDLLNTYRETLLEKNRRQLLLVSPGKIGMKNLLDGSAKQYIYVDKPETLKASMPSYQLR